MARHRLLIVNAILMLTLLGSLWGRHIEGATLAQPLFLQHLDLPFRNWTSQDAGLSHVELSLLQPDAFLVRRYRDRSNGRAELAVIAGHRKRSIHTPGFCMEGKGLETLWTRACHLRLPEREIEATRSLMTQDNHQLLVTYFFTDGVYTTRDLLQFQCVQMLKRFRSQIPLGALVRILVPVERDQAAAEKLCDEFALATVPGVMRSLRQACLQVR